MDCDDSDELSVELVAAANSVKEQLLPATSKERYSKTYDVFKQWKQSKNVKRTSETVLEAYFHKLAENKRPTSLWAYHSMLKATIKVKENVDISAYHQLNAFLKRQIKGYVPVKAKVFTEAEIQRFIFQTDDSAWLDVKVRICFRKDVHTELNLTSLRKYCFVTWMIMAACISCRLGTQKLKKIDRSPSLEYFTASLRSIRKCDLSMHRTTVSSSTINEENARSKQLANKTG